MDGHFSTKEAPSSGSVIFSGAFIAEDLVTSLHNLAPIQSYPATVELFRQGSAAQEVFFIERGLVKLTAISESGQELIVGLRSSGRLLGVAPVILRKVYPTSAVTITRCQLRRFPAESMLNMLTYEPQFSRRLHLEQSLEIYDQQVQLVEISSLPARCRLERLFLQMISEMDMTGSQKEIRLQLALKQWEIAQLITITPQHLSRVLKELEQEGIIRRERGWLIISEPKKLRHLPDLQS